jgi:hypothetical protein
MMDFFEVAAKYLRFPWDVYHGNEHFRDAEIAASVAFECGAGDFFKEVPSPDHMRDILHTCAKAVTLALIRGRGETLQQRNRWNFLTDDERKFILQITGLDTARHKSVLLLSIDADWRFRVASYVAAMYAFTTYTKPYVIAYDRFVQAAFNSFETDSFEMADLRRAGLLILVGAGGPVRGADKVYGFLSSLLSKRMAQGKLHMFIDAPDGNVLDTMLSGRQATRDEVRKMYRDIFPPSLRMDNMLFGPSVYLDPIDRPLTGFADERGKAVII